jgi:hypothetical protein
LVAFAFFNRPAVALELREGQLRRTPAESALARLYRWAASTEDDAVFVTDPRPPLVAAVGNMPEFPALTGRVLFIGFQSSYVVVPNPDAKFRGELAIAAVEGRLLTAPQLAYIGELGRPVYLITNRGSDPAVTQSLQSQFGPAVFQQDELAAYRIR